MAVTPGGGLTVSELALDGDREAIRAQTCLLALDQVLAVVGTSQESARAMLPPWEPTNDF